jgi:hypothetical protein
MRRLSMVLNLKQALGIGEQRYCLTMQTISTQFFSIQGMPNDTDQRRVSTLIRWTEDEWRTIARELCAKQGGEPMRALDLQKIKARDVFVAQEVLPEDRHRKLASIAQGFAGIRARLDALTQMVPAGEQVTACAEKTEVGPERRTASDTAASVLLASEQDLEASYQMTECDGLAAEQTSERDVISESQRSRSIHQASEGSERSQQPVHIPGLMEAMRPFLVMVCEEIAKALVKVIANQGLKGTFPAASSQARSRVSSREEALHRPMVEEGLPNPSPGKTTHEHRLVNEADVKSVDIDFASEESEEEGDEGDVLDVQPLFDPKLPPSPDSDFKPKIGLVSTPGSDFEGLRQRYPQLHLTIVQADALSDVRRFGHCQRIIALREEISAGTDALLSRLLRHRYIRLDGGMNGVIAQLDAWLASPGSIAAGSRRRVPFSGIERNAASRMKRQNRYPKRISDAG